MRRISVTPLLLFVLFALPAAGAPPPGPPQFLSLGVSDGLPSSVVYTTVQDRVGFVWIGTQDGLARYDGIDFRVHRHDPNDPRSLASNDVSAILIDRDGVLWCGGEANGLNRLEPDGRSFTHWRHRAGALGTLGSDDVFTIAQDREGVIWVGTYLGGLNRLEPDGSFVHVDHDAEDPQSLRSSTVYVLEADAHGRLWIGTDAGLDVREADGQIHHVELPPLAARGVRPLVSALLPDADDSMLVGTSGGIFRVGADLRYREEIASGPLPLRVSALARDARGVLWIGTASGGARLDKVGLQPFGRGEGVAGAYPGQSTQHIRGDVEGGMWFSLYDGGIARLSPHWRNFSVFRHLPGEAASLSGPRAAAIGLAVDGAVWVGSGTDGLDRIDRSSGRVERFGARLGLRGPRLTAVLGDRAGHLWIGTQSGLRHLDPRGGESVELPVDLRRGDALPPGFVNRLLQAADGSVWASVRGGGIARLADDPPRLLRRYLPSAGTLGDSDVVALVLDPAGKPWIATASGVERFLAEEDRFERVVSLPRESIHGIGFAPDGSLWLHRLGALERYWIDAAGARLQQRHDASVGWPALTAAALEVAADGSVWVTSPRGLWRVDPQGGIRNFGVGDGLPSSEFLPGALARAADGVLYAGTLAGVVAFDSSTMEFDSPPPPVVLSALGVRRSERQQQLDLAVPVVLRHDDRDLHIEARALSFVNPRANRYRFLLEGFDPEWIDSDRGERNYSQLPPGSYRLRVRAANADGVWSELALPLPIRSLRAPWATPAAWLIYALLLLLAGYVLLLGWRRRLRERHARLLAEERRRSAEQLVQAKSDFLATLGHEIRTPMTGVLGMSELLLATPLDVRQRGYAGAIHQSGELLLRLVNDSLDIARIDAGKLALDEQPFDPGGVLREVAELERPLAERKGLRVETRVADDVPALLMGDAIRVRQILLNLVNNAVKFTAQGGVRLGLERASDSRLRFLVADTGVGMDEAQRSRLFRRFEQAAGVTGRHGGSGLGLAISHELALLMGGSLEVGSEPGRGSSFAFELPLREASPQAAPAAKPGSTREIPALSILLVEDDKTVADVIRELLGARGHRVQHVVNGLAALAALETAACDLALLDLDLPGIDGLQLARAIRAGRHRELPLLAITARSVGDEEQLIGAAGMNALLRKPLTAERLIEAIEAALARQAESSATPTI